jgi:hypothetical protein
LAPAGLAAVTDAKADESWTALDAVEELVEPEAARLAAQGIRANQWRQPGCRSLNFPIAGQNLLVAAAHRDGCRMWLRGGS